MPEKETESLAQLLAERGRLTQGQVVTVGVQVARDLAKLHASGHVYADVSADSVLIDANGRPSLAPATSGGGEPADDVRALAEMLRAAAGANAGLALLRVLSHPMDAASLACDLYAVCPPAPLRPAPRATTRRRWPTV